MEWMSERTEPHPALWHMYICICMYIGRVLLFLSEADESNRAASMAMDGAVSHLHLHLIAFLAFLLSTHDATAVKFTFRNNCPETVWPATLTSSGPAFPTTGFPLPPGASLSFSGVGGTWSGRVWARYRCTTSASPGARFSCESGDCGTGQVVCGGAGGAPPATLAEFTLGGGGGGKQDFYDVSNVDGFNLPVEIEPAAGRARCRSTSCPADINRVCPSELAVRAASAAAAMKDGGDGAVVVGCKSACLAFGTDAYCCRGQFASPATCKPSGYSKLFKAECPQAYSYAYDDRSSTFTCNGSAVDYRLTFCPAGSGTTRTAALPAHGNSMM